jgi:hypothetical protein
VQEHTRRVQQPPDPARRIGLGHDLDQTLGLHHRTRALDATGRQLVRLLHASILPAARSRSPGP